MTWGNGDIAMLPCVVLTRAHCPVVSVVSVEEVGRVGPWGKQGDEGIQSPAHTGTLQYSSRGTYSSLRLRSSFTEGRVFSCSTLYCLSGFAFLPACHTAELTEESIAKYTIMPRLCNSADVSLASQCGRWPIRMVET